MTAAGDSAGIKMVPLAELAPHPLNPRLSLGDLGELAASTAAQGLFEPLVVLSAAAHAEASRADGGDGLGPPITPVIVMGHRRHAAAQEAGLAAVPVLVRDDLTDCRAAFGNADALPTTTLITRLRADLEAPWCDHGPDGITARRLGILLSDYDIRSANIRFGEPIGQVKGYYRADFTDAWARYCTETQGYPSPPLRHRRRCRMTPTALAVPQLYRVPDAMRLLSMSRSVIYEQLRAGRLRSVRQGRARLIPAAAIADYIALLEAEAEGASRP